MEVADEHPLLFHYTTAAGLLGILETHQLWATHIGYLNDAEERTLFFDERLPYIIRPSIARALADLQSDDEIKAAIAGMGGMEAAISKTVDQFAANIKDHTFQFGTPFVTSFCPPTEKDRDNGLLSQWRGYGGDGGYAVVFDTRALSEHMKHETGYNYEHLAISDVLYIAKGQPAPSSDKSVQDAERHIHDAVYSFFTTQQSSSFDPMYSPINTLSCCTKHRGFQEEVEVRIIATPVGDVIYDESVASGDTRPRKKVYHRVVGGMLVPYIKLFDHAIVDQYRLPIKKIIVGPHPDRAKRADAVWSLLRVQQYKDVEVVESRIPYIGK